jgi:hypothetical protein
LDANVWCLFSERPMSKSMELAEGFEPPTG